MTLEIYRLTIFLICFSIGIQVIEISGIVSGVHTGYSDAYSNADINRSLRYVAGDYMFNNAISQDLSYLALTLAVFGLLVFTLPFMLALFWFGYILGADLILYKLPLPTELQAGLMILLSITYMVGYKQYQANVSLRQF